MRVVNASSASSLTTPSTHLGQLALRQGDRAFTYEQLRQRAVTMAEGLHTRGRDTEKFGIRTHGALTGAGRGAPGRPRGGGGSHRHRHRLATAARTELIIQRSGASLVVSEDNFARLAAGAAEPVSLSPLDDGTKAACVFFTSGSTGQPKGVMSPHRGTIRTLVDCPSVPSTPTACFSSRRPSPGTGCPWSCGPRC